MRFVVAVMTHTRNQDHNWSTRATVNAHSFEDAKALAKAIETTSSAVLSRECSVQVEIPAPFPGMPLIRIPTDHIDDFLRALEATADEITRPGRIRSVT
jgi:hypothetical protein